MFQANEAGDKSSAELKKELEKTRNDLEVSQSGRQLLMYCPVMLSTVMLFNEYWMLKLRITKLPLTIVLEVVYLLWEILKRKEKIVKLHVTGNLLISQN